MTDMLCTYAGDRDEAMIDYLYDDGDPAARAGFESHLAACARCRHEVDALRGVRRQLARWSPPEVNFVVGSRQSGVESPEPRGASSEPVILHRAWWHEIPAWAQVAAALLVLGASAGIANLDVRYDNNGLSVRTGWAPPPRNASAPPVVASTGAAAPWRPDLAALEQELRAEIRAVPASANVSAAPSEADVLRRARALIDESEKRQQRELALKVGEVERDFTAARQADLRKIDYNLNGVRTGFDVVYKQQQEQQQMLLRVSQRQ